jgi:hypothetical protein
MKIRRSVNILGHDYKVKREPLGGNVAGVTRFPERTIALEKTLKGETLTLTFLHEIWHAYQYENGDMQIMHPQVQEKSCDQFASFIISLKKQKVI